MLLTYLGEPGGYGDYGRNRSVFYSDVAAPRIKEMFTKAGNKVSDDLENACKDKRVKAAITHKPIARRLEDLKDIVCD